MASGIQLLSCCVRVCVCVSCVAMLCESASSIAEPSINCNGNGPPEKICVFQRGALCHKQDEYFVPDDVLPAGVEDYTTLLDPIHYVNYLQYTRARSFCAAENGWQTIWQDQTYARPCKKHIHILSRMPPKKAKFDTTRPTTLLNGTVFIGHAHHEAGAFFHDILDNVLSDFAAKKEAEQIMGAEIRNIRIIGGTATPTARHLYRLWGAMPDHHFTDTCFETAIVGKVSTIQKEYLLSREHRNSWEAGNKGPGPGWEDQYYMQPQVLHAFRDAVIAAVTLRHVSECSQAGSLKLLYVVRSRTKWPRKVTNDGQLMDAIQRSSTRWCITRVTLESRSLDEQIQLMHDADVALATHGASGALAIFMRPGAYFIELQGDNWDRRWALDLATLSGVHTMVFRNQTSVVPDRGAPGWAHNESSYQTYRDADVTVDVESVKRVFEALASRLQRVRL